MLPRGSLRPRRGFTTIEALIAAVVFLLGLSGLLGALTQARNATAQARRYMQATDIANDLLEQMQLWAPDDTRLGATPAGPCMVDPLDKAGDLLQPRTSSRYQTYATCMRGDADIKASGRSWAGLTEPSFTDEQGNRTDYYRYYIVQSEVVRPGVRRLQIWVKVRYDDAGEPRVVTAQGMRVVMGGS